MNNDIICCEGSRCRIKPVNSLITGLSSNVNFKNDILYRQIVSAVREGYIPFVISSRNKDNGFYAYVNNIFYEGGLVYFDSANSDNNYYYPFQNMSANSITNFFCELAGSIQSQFGNSQNLRNYISVCVNVFFRSESALRSLMTGEITHMNLLNEIDNLRQNNFISETEKATLKNAANSAQSISSQVFGLIQDYLFKTMNFAAQETYDIQPHGISPSLTQEHITQSRRTSPSFTQEHITQPCRISPPLTQEPVIQIRRTSQTLTPGSNIQPRITSPSITQEPAIQIRRTSQAFTQEPNIQSHGASQQNTNGPVIQIRRASPSMLINRTSRNIFNAETSLNEGKCIYLHVSDEIERGINGFYNLQCFQWYIAKTLKMEFENKHDLRNIRVLFVIDNISPVILDWFSWIIDIPQAILLINYDDFYAKLSGVQDKRQQLISRMETIYFFSHMNEDSAEWASKFFGNYEAQKIVVTEHPPEGWLEYIFKRKSYAYDKEEKPRFSAHEIKHLYNDGIVFTRTRQIFKPCYRENGRNYRDKNYRGRVNFSPFTFG